MQELFSFLKNPYLSFLNESLNTLVGIERIDLLFYNESKKRTEVHSIQRSKNKQKSFELQFNQDTEEKINAFRRKQNNQSWIGLKDIPYSPSSQEILNPDLFSEFESHVLGLGFPNKSDYSKDVYLFYFRKNAADFGLTKSDKLLSTSNKAIISHLLFHTVSNRLNDIKHNQQSLRILNEQSRLLMESKQSLVLKNKALIEQNKENTTQLAEFLINDLSRDEDDVFYLSEEAKQIIGSFSGGLMELKEHVSRAMLLAKTLHFGSLSNEFILKADYFNFSKPEKQLPPIADVLSEENSKHKHAKTYGFLNEMENAAQTVLKLGWKLTSANVGHHFEKPITAAAISDKLKHHSDKIIRLLDQYPVKWPLIRKRFRPLQNIIIKAKEHPIQTKAS
jgi:hypothetical protein